MNKDSIKGKVKEVEGRIQRQAGEWTGSKEDQVKGMARQAEGEVQETVGKMKDAAKDVVNRKPATQKPDKGSNLPAEDYEDARRRRDVESDVVPNRDDDVGEEVA